jgi:hypothetical protein
MNAGTRVFLGDLVRALKETGDSRGENWKAIASMLGFQFGEARASVSAQGRAQAQETDRQGAGSGAQRQSPAETGAPSKEEDIGELVAFDLERSTSPPESIVLDAALPESPASAPPSSRPLLDPLWQRGILIESAGTLDAAGDVAILEAVDLFARGAPLLDLPAVKIRGVSKGCQVLVDAGLGMQPFASDTGQIVGALRKAVGSEHTRVLTFIDCPTMGVMTESFGDTHYTPPDNGAMVIALTDICSGGPRSAIREAEPEDWLTVAKRIRDAGSDLLILNPYLPDRWPARVRERVAVVHWDLSTRAVDVRQTRRHTAR